MSVTQKAVFTLPNGIHRVEDCLYLRVQDSGRSFIFRYMKDGKRRDIGVGSAQKVSVAQAKAIAAKYRTEIAAGGEPKSKTDKKEKMKIRTFREVSVDAFENTRDVKRWKRDVQARRWLAILTTYAMPLIGDKPISEIGRQDVIEVLSPIWIVKNPTALRLRTILERIFAYAIFIGEYHGANPAVYKGNLDIVLPPSAKIHNVEHHGALTFEQMKEFLPQCLEIQSAAAFASVIIALSALRANEVTSALWDEINFDEAIFYVPPERRKIRREYPHRVPLSNQMLAILKFMENQRRSKYVFQSFVRRECHITSETPTYFIQRLMGKEITIHGCRSTFRVWAEETGQNATAAEYQMMHENPSAVVRAYQRSDLLEQRRELMQRWADEVLPMDVLMKALGAKP